MKCNYKDCLIINEKDLQEHHIVDKAIILKKYPLFKEGKLYDMVHINGILLKNRIYLCKNHHKIIHSETKNIKGISERYFKTRSFLK